MSVAGAAGALYSTVEDLARWNDAVFGGKVLSQASLAAAFAPVQVGSSPPGEDGYGWNIGHGGGLPGFVSHLARYPDDGLTVAVLVNSAPPPPGLDPDQIGRAIAQLYLADRMEPRRRPAAVSLPPEALERFVGRYDYGNAVLTVTREGDRLFARLGGQPRFEVFPSGPNEFFWKAVEARVEFVSDESGRVIKAIHHQGPAPLEAPRIEETSVVKLEPLMLDAYVGRYDYGGGTVIMTVTREGDHLFAQLTGQPRFEIFPSSQTEFSWKVVPAKITFVKDATGRVTGGIHEQGGRRLNVPKIE
jgi:hypothetical protein